MHLRQLSSAAGSVLKNQNHVNQEINKCENLALNMDLNLHERNDLGQAAQNQSSYQAAIKNAQMMENQNQKQYY